MSRPTAIRHLVIVAVTVAAIAPAGAQRPAQPPTTQGQRETYDYWGGAA